MNAGLSIFCGYYLDPETDGFRRWTTPDILRYLKVAKNLGLHGRISYVLPLDDVPGEALVPFLNYLSLKFTGVAISSINNVKWASVVLEMCQAYADEAGLPVQEVLAGVHIHLISPLRLGRKEAEIFLFFAERDLRIGVGAMTVPRGHLTGHLRRVVGPPPCAVFLCQYSRASIFRREGAPL